MRLTRSTPIRQPYQHLYVSPHFDDLVLSCGGRVVRQRVRGERVAVVGVFTGKPAAGLAVTDFAAGQHRRWGGKRDPIADRRREERLAMDALDVDYLWLDHLDAIYRGEQYLSDEHLFGPIGPHDSELAGQLAAQLATIVRQAAPAEIYAPLGAGNHVDHQIARDAALMADRAGATLSFYEDFPYSVRPDEVGRARDAIGRRLEPEIVEIGAAVDEKVRVIGLYRSQIPTLFGDPTGMERAVRAYCARQSREPVGFAERYWRLVLGRGVYNSADRRPDGSQPDVAVLSRAVRPRDRNPARRPPDTGNRRAFTRHRGRAPDRR